jgi:hypothetical protein
VRGELACQSAVDVRRNGESFGEALRVRNGLVEGVEEHDDDPDSAEDPAQDVEPLSVALAAIGATGRC